MDTEKKTYAKLDGKNCFLELTDWFEKGLVKLNFGKYNMENEAGNRLSLQIPIYFTPFEAKKFYFECGRPTQLRKMLEVQKQKDPSFSGTLYQGKMGGGTTEGNLVARSFSVSAADDGNYFITASQGAGNRTSSGGITFQKGGKQERITIKVSDYTFQAFMDVLQIVADECIHLSVRQEFLKPKGQQVS